MTTQPFFSVVIPTKDRPALLPDAIHSVVRQDFADYEVIVSDNFNDDRTRQSVAPFLGHPRLRYVRTDAELPMPAHWEFATARARGQFVLVVTDRSVLMQGTLGRIHRTLVSQQEEVAVCSWRWSFFDEREGVLFGDAPGIDRGAVAVLGSAEIARAFMNRSGEYPYALPRGLNSCYRQDVARAIRERVGGLFVPVSPDFTSAFLLLAHTPHLIYIDDALFISQGLAVSNGGRGVAATCEPYLETLDGTDAYAHVPIKAPIVENVIFNDFLAIQQRVGRNLAGVRVNWVEYFVACYRELLEKKGAGLISAAALSEMFAAWDAALAGADRAIREGVKARLSRWAPLRAKILLKRSPVGPFLVGLKRHLETSRRGGSTARHTHVLGAAGFETPVPRRVVHADSRR